MTYFSAKYSLYDISRENITELAINMQQTHPSKWKQWFFLFFFLMSILSWVLYLNLRRFSAAYEGVSTLQLRKTAVDSIRMINVVVMYCK